jgi:hypothetical protein
MYLCVVRTDAPCKPWEYECSASFSRPRAVQINASTTNISSQLSCCSATTAVDLARAVAAVFLFLLAALPRSHLSHRQPLGTVLAISINLIYSFVITGL